jgi:hypothetical protein
MSPPEPQRERGRIHNQNLLRDKLRRREHNVLAAVRDVAQQLVRGPAVPHLPENVRQGDGERDRAAEQNPFLCKMSALGCEEQRNENAAAEECHRMLVLETEPGEHTEPEPESGGPPLMMRTSK